VNSTLDQLALIVGYSALSIAISCWKGAEVGEGWLLYSTIAVKGVVTLTGVKLYASGCGAEVPLSLTNTATVVFFMRGIVYV